MGRAAPLLLCCLAGVLAPAEAPAQAPGQAVPAPAQPPVVAARERATKSWSSSNGLYAIRFVTTARGDRDECRVEVVKGAEKVWTLPRCVGTIDDVFLVDDGGQRFWVLRVLPKIPPERRKKKRYPAPHFSAEVAALYDANGKALRTYPLQHFLAPHRLGLVRELGGHFKWLEGVAGVPGKAPRVTEKNEVQFESVAQKTHTLKFK